MQVLVARATEGILPRPARSARDVPRSAEDITAAWLSAVLCPMVPAAEVTSLSAVTRSSGTTNRTTLALTYNEVGASAGLPTRVFVKSTSGLGQRLMLGLGGFIHGEPGFYTHVRPRLGIEAPIGYFGAVEPRSWRSVVLMEDVASTRGATFWSPGAKLTRTGIEDLLRNVAGWHGALWDSPLLAQWHWLRAPADQMRLIDALIGMANRLPAGAKRARAVVPASLRNRQSDLYAGLRRSMQIAGSGARTYLHGDLHIANTYTTDTGARGVCDWQTALRGSWSHDYAYLLATSLSVDDRRAWERELLDFYLEQLAAAGGERVPRAKAWEAYRKATFYPYFAWIYTIGRSRLQPRFQPDETSLVFIERITAAIEDLGSLDAVGL